MRTTPPPIWSLIGLNPTGDLRPYTIYTSRRGRVVWYYQAPPDKPPSWLQLRHRNRWRLLGRQWRAETTATRQLWQLAARRAQLRVTGYNLYTYWHLTRDRQAIRTVERLARLALIT